MRNRWMKLIPLIIGLSFIYIYYLFILQVLTLEYIAKRQQYFHSVIDNQTAQKKTKLVSLVQKAYNKIHEKTSEC